MDFERSMLERDHFRKFKTQSIYSSVELRRGSNSGTRLAGIVPCLSLPICRPVQAGHRTETVNRHVKQSFTARVRSQDPHFLAQAYRPLWRTSGKCFAEILVRFRFRCHGPGARVLPVLEVAGLESLSSDCASFLSYGRRRSDVVPSMVKARWSLVIHGRFVLVVNASPNSSFGVHLNKQELL